MAKRIRTSDKIGRQFRADMENLVSVLRQEIQQAVQKEDFELKRNSIMQQVQTDQTEKLSELEKKVSEAGFMLQRNPAGVFIPQPGIEYQAAA